MPKMNKVASSKRLFYRKALIRNRERQISQGPTDEDGDISFLRWKISMRLSKIRSNESNSNQAHPGRRRKGGLERVYVFWRGGAGGTGMYVGNGSEGVLAREEWLIGD